MCCEFSILILFNLQKVHGPKICSYCFPFNFNTFVDFHFSGEKTFQYCYLIAGAQHWVSQWICSGTLLKKSVFEICAPRDFFRCYETVQGSLYRPVSKVWKYRSAKEIKERNLDWYKEQKMRDFIVERKMNRWNNVLKVEKFFMSKWNRVRP